ncbi:putative CCR4-NOT complex subunit/5 domain superfamily protein [Helianthus debilis subsp. tardiflorus]
MAHYKTFTNINERTQPLFMFFRLTYRTKFLVRDCSFIKRMDINELPNGSRIVNNQDISFVGVVFSGFQSSIISPWFMMQMGRSSGFNLGGVFSSHRSQPQQVPSISTSSVSFSSVNNQDLSPLHGSDVFQVNAGLTNRQCLVFSSSQSFKDLGVKSMQVSQTAPDWLGLLGILSVIRVSDPDLTSLALGIDLTTLGLNLNSSENLHRTFGSPWLDEPSKEPPEFTVPQCYDAKQPPVLNQGYLSKFQYNRGWFYHREHRLWFMRAANIEPLVKTKTYERGSYVCFDPNTWETVRKENFVVYYEMLEKRPTLPQHGRFYMYSLLIVRWLW